MNFPDDWFGLLLLSFSAIILIWTWLDISWGGHREKLEKEFRNESRLWVEEGRRLPQNDFVAVRGVEWRWVVDPWRTPPWIGTKWEKYYEEIYGQVKD